jgi:hypothetical protein
MSNKDITLDAARQVLLDHLEKVGTDNWGQLEWSMVLAVNEMNKCRQQPSGGTTFVLASERLNSPQLNSVRALIQRAKHAHTTDIVMRINGEDVRTEADWLKWLEEVS